MGSTLLPDKHDMWRVGIGAARAIPFVAGIAVYAKTQSLLYSIGSSILGGILGAYTERRIRNSEVGNALLNFALKPGYKPDFRRVNAAFSGLNR